MALSVLDLFSIGIGPSSSHTVGPMRAARRFVAGLARDGLLDRAARVEVELYGSLGATGRGHHSDLAVLLGLEGEEPESVDTAAVPSRAEAIRTTGRLRLGGEREIAWSTDDLVLHLRRSLPDHPNGMTFQACDERGEVLARRTYYSIGGGFVVDPEEAKADQLTPDHTELPHPFRTGEELLAQCRREGASISEVVRRNEEAFRPWDQTRAKLLRVWAAMQECVASGLRREGTLPGGLHVPRRAPALRRRLESAGQDDPLHGLDWVNLWALAVNEENASGGRVVTAPTNGAAGVIPAVLHHYVRHVPGADEEGVLRFLLAAGAVGIIVKENASISGAEVGCQGEVGSACAMAAAGLAEAVGLSPEQVENAAEIGLEHNLGLTCDPVGGLVQIPCIERNAVAAAKAITATRLAGHGDGTHHVSLDTAIATMRDTGADMKRKYKETSLGGLALKLGVHVTEC